MKTTMAWKKYQKLGEGSSGTVYLAAEEAKGSFFSSPWPPYAAVTSAKIEESWLLLQEAELLKEFTGDPYVVQTYGLDYSFEGEVGILVYNLFMEYATGGTLHDLIQGYRGIMPEALVAYYSYLMLQGISNVHGKEVIHSDIKPSNILVFKPVNGTKSHLKLAGFGYGRYEWEEETMSFRGTIQYASPESILGGRRGKGNDIWSFGCTVVEMLTGTRPIQNVTNSGDRIVQLGPPEIPQSVSDLGRDFLMRCFQVNTEDRWTADMLLEHPFITMNTRGVVPPWGSELDNLIKINDNPFCDPGYWFRSEGLVSSSSLPTQAKQPQQGFPFLEYQLFP